MENIKSDILNTKLISIYKECVEELRSIGIDILNSNIGLIYIQISKRNNKRYACCKQEEPDKSSIYYEKIGKKTYLRYAKFNKHIIEVSSWVMQLEESIIKNTIIHEIIHCFPYCNNHQKKFKEYAKLINEKLGYNISRVGNKIEDFEKSNITYNENINFRYKIYCEKCGQTFYRQRLMKKLIKRYKCGKCGGKLKYESI